jgi:hypothetical protein
MDLSFYATLGEKDHAERTIPNFLHIRPSIIANAGRGVFTSMDLPIGFVFGPYRGRLLTDGKKAAKNGYSWKIRNRGANSQFLDGEDCRVANWMRFINSSRCQSAFPTPRWERGGRQ